MFDKQYKFLGRHAIEVERLAQAFYEKDVRLKVFERFVDIFINAPVVGFLYGRRSDADYTKDENGAVYNRNVMDAQIIGNSEALLFRYRLLMLLDKDFEPDEEKRLDVAFRETGSQPRGEERFYQYLRGGVDVLYEKIINDAESPDDYLQNLLDFIHEINERFNNQVDMDTLSRLIINEFSSRNE